MTEQEDRKDIFDAIAGLFVAAGKVIAALWKSLTWRGKATIIIGFGAAVGGVGDRSQGFPVARKFLAPLIGDSSASRDRGQFRQEVMTEIKALRSDVRDVKAKQDTLGNDLKDVKRVVAKIPGVVDRARRDRLHREEDDKRSRDVFGSVGMNNQGERNGH